MNGHKLQPDRVPWMTQKHYRARKKLDMGGYLLHAFICYEVLEK